MLCCLCALASNTRDFAHCECFLMRKIPFEAKLSTMFKPFTLPPSALLHSGLPPPAPAPLVCVPPCSPALSFTPPRLEEIQTHMKTLVGKGFVSLNSVHAFPEASVLVISTIQSNINFTNET